VDVVCTLYNHFVVNMPNHLVPSLLQADDGLTEDVSGHRLGDVFCYPASVCVDPDVVLARVQEGHPALTTVLRRHPLLTEPMIGDRPPGRQVQVSTGAVGLHGDMSGTDRPSDSERLVH